MENKIKFPKGSLTFLRLKEKEFEYEKTPEWRKKLEYYVIRKKFINGFEKTFPGQDKILTGELNSLFIDVKDRMQATRAEVKELPSFTISNNYQITFKHPKWSKVLGEISLKTDKANLKASLNLIREEFKLRKNEFRKLRSKEKVVKIQSYRAYIKYKVSGGIIYMPEVKEGIYLKFLKDMEKKIVFTPKKPKDSSNYVGVELEFLCEADKDKLGLLLFDAGLGKQVTLTEDGSLRCCPDDDRHSTHCEKHKGLFEHELCILLKEDNYKETMKKVCEVLAKVKAIVNKSCGMHVHLDMRNRNAEMAYQNLVSAQGILFKMNPKSRTQTYAKKVTSRNFEEVKNVPSGGTHRYVGINATAINKHTTLEVRIHSGTIDYTKITNWIGILLQVTNHTERIINNYISIKTFCKDFNISDELQSYMEERIEKFKIDKGILGTNEPQAEVGAA